MKHRSLLLLALLSGWGCNEPTTMGPAQLPISPPLPAAPSSPAPRSPATPPPPAEVPTWSCADAPVPSYPLSDEPYTTLQQVWSPLKPSTLVKAKITTRLLKVTEIAEYAPNGLGVEERPGLPWIEHRELAPGFEEGLSSTRRSLAWFWQAADPQMIDEESPIRFEAFSQLYRPQGHLIPQVFNAHVQTIRRISDHSNRPLEFAVLAGDLTDGSQRNELHWVFDILNGGIIDPDSGIDDDPVPGAGNDYNDPFCAEGFPIPWYPALGNHETLYNGGFGAITEAIRVASMGGRVYTDSPFPNGFRDGSTPHGEVVSEGETPPDPNRLVLRLPEVLEAILEAGGSPEGHGLTPENAGLGMGYYSVHPVPGKPIRLITLKTVNPDALLGLGHLGYLDTIQFDWLQSELDAADANKELVILVSHHGSEDIGFTSPVSGEDLQDALLQCKGMVLHLMGHGHQNEKHVVRSNQRGYWELMLASTVDFPMQSRLVELVDEGNGFLSIYITNVGHNSSIHSLAHRARELSAGKITFLRLIRGDVNDYWEKNSAAQNLLLRMPMPEDFQSQLNQFSWSSVIESETTLLNF